MTTEKLQGKKTDLLNQLEGLELQRAEANIAIDEKVAAYRKELEQEAFANYEQDFTKIQHYIDFVNELLEEAESEEEQKPAEEEKKEEEVEETKPTETVPFIQFG